MADDRLKGRIHDPMAPGGADRLPPTSSAATALRMAGQILGLLLIVVGGYYGLKIVADIIAVVRSPASLEPAVVAMVQTMGLETASVPVYEERLPIGRAAAMGTLLLWYIVCTWACLKVVTVGGRLISEAMGERREFLAAMREFLASTRAEGKDRPGQHRG